MSDVSTIKLIGFFSLWYLINILYNDLNKTVLQVLKLPWSVASLQLGTGLLYVAPLWLNGIKSPPRLKLGNLVSLLPIALAHGLGQCVTVFSLGAGSLAFVNVVKALEPFFNVIFGAIFMGDVLPWQVNACLIPVVLGVALASAAELQFTWDCFAFAMGSNIAFALRGVLTKKLSTKPKDHNMDPGNTFAMITTMAFLLVLPIALYLEGPILKLKWNEALRTGVYTEKELLGRIVGSGLSFYLYNEVAMYTLDAVHPITHAVGNTIKRVILIIFSVVRFGTEMTAQSAGGSAVAIMGVFMYSVAKSMFKPKPKEA